MIKVHKHTNGEISIFEITKDNEVIMSGDGWKEKLGPDKLPIYGSLRTGKFKSKEIAEAVLQHMIKILDI